MIRNLILDRGGRGHDNTSQLFGIVADRRILSRKKDKYNGPKYLYPVTNSMRDKEGFEKA